MLHAASLFTLSTLAAASMRALASRASGAPERGSFPKHELVDSYVFGRQGTRDGVAEPLLRTVVLAAPAGPVPDASKFHATG